MTNRLNWLALGLTLGLPLPFSVLALPAHPAAAAAFGEERGDDKRTEEQDDNRRAEERRAARAGAIHSLTLEAGSGRVVKFSDRVSNLYVADPKVADAKPSGTNGAFVFGVGPGETTIVGTDDGGHILDQYHISILPAAALLRDAQSAIRARLGPGISVIAEETGAQLTGTVDTPADADTATSILRGYLPKGVQIQNDLIIAGALQVTLRVRVVEMSRTLTRDLGVNWKDLGGDMGAFAKIGLTGAATMADAASGSNGTAQLAASLNRTNVQAIVDALAEDQLIRTLAEPNLTTISGHPASFLVGGEFPIPVTQQLGQTSVQFKSYGISLAFVPTVLSSGQINIKVRPEVSALTTQGAVSFTEDNYTMTIPAISVRRAETTVELGSGQTFAIAGLLQDNVTQDDQGTPFLGDVPYLGSLFKTDSFKRTQTELVILVTPYIVRPVSNPRQFHVPDENYRIPGDMDRLVLLRQVGREKKASAVTVPGNVGFITR